MPADGVMPTPDMTTVRPAAEPTLSEREEQKLAMYRQRHPVAGGGVLRAGRGNPEPADEHVIGQFVGGPCRVSQPEVVGRSCAAVGWVSSSPTYIRMPCRVDPYAAVGGWFVAAPRDSHL
jgi:hypothetical protein